MLNVVNHSDQIRLGVTHYHAPTRTYGFDSSYRNYNVLRYATDLYGYDPLLADIGGLEFRRPDLVPIRGNFGYPGDDVIANVKPIYGFPLSMFDMPSKITRLATMSSVLQFITGDKGIADMSNEHSAAHTNIIGSIDVGAVCNPTPGGPNSNFYLGASIDVGGVGFSQWGDARTLGITVPTMPTRDLVGLITERYEAGFYSVIGGPWDANASIRDLKFYFENDCLMAVTYTLWNAGWGSPGDGITDFLAEKWLKVGFGVVWGVTNSYTQTQPTTNASYMERFPVALRKFVKCYRHYFRKKGNQPVYFTSPTFLGSSPDYWPTANCRTEPSYCWSCSTNPQRGWESYSGISGEGGYRKINTGTTSFYQFRNEARRWGNDLLVMGFLAQTDAYEQNYRFIQANLVETLSELGDIMALVENPFDLIRGLLSLRGGRVDHSVRELVNMFTDATLYYSFMLSPTISLAEEMASKASGLLKKLDTFFGYQTINGKATYIIGEEIPSLAGSVVVGHSKMRVRVPPDSLLAMILPLEKLHLLPDFSTYWETLRMSFVVDWLFNVQGKLSVIDNTVKQMALDCGGVVNSVTLYKPIQSCNFMVEDDSSYKYFSRWVLPGPQVFTPTTLGVLSGSGVPNWLVAGSLIYKFL